MSGYRNTEWETYKNRRNQEWLHWRGETWQGKELEETVPGKWTGKVTVCSLIWRVKSWQLEIFVFLQRTRLILRNPTNCPSLAVFLCPWGRWTVAIIIFLRAAKQPQTRSKTQTDLRLIRTTDLDILPMHQTTRHCRGQRQPGRCVPRDFSMVPCFP